MIGITAMTVLSSCANKENVVKGQPDQSTQEIFAMDTYMSLTAYGSNSEEAVNKAVQEINRLDEMFSVGNEDSDVTKINENGNRIYNEQGNAGVRKDQWGFRYYGISSYGAVGIYDKKLQSARKQ